MKRDSVGREYVRVGESRPIPKTVDWANAPSQFKLYRGCPKILLDGPADDHALGRLPLGRFLRDVYGLIRQRWTAPGDVSPRGRRRVTARAKPFASNTLRPVPAGGARYPCELYLLAGPDQPVPAGVYHYDPAHHCLDVLRETAPESGLSLLITVAFWKNVFKYGEFSYRLHSLDAGVVLGQSLAVASRYGLDPTVHFQFSDAALAPLLGLDPAYESVYAVVTFGPTPLADPAPAGADGLASQPTPPHPDSIGLYPLPAKLHQVAMQQGGGPWPKGDRPSPVPADAPVPIRSVPLPAAPLDLLDGLERRRSSKGYFRPGTLSRHQLSALLSGSMRGYLSDLGDDDDSTIRHTMLFGAVHDVEGVDSGVYYYDPVRHALEQVRAGDVSAELQAAMTSMMFNLHQINLCFFPVAHYEPRLAAYGDRWYRVQNMEAGIIVQRLYLAAATLGLGCHTQMGFHVDAVNTLLGLGETPLTSLIHVLIAPSHDPGIYYDYKI
ncbi:MAG TPA: SagB family peptide dehydrogenase [Pseudonocardiaceae bacterium]|nr:SagB family peptide dehydrogenase [Pseudonocardiaceae bacterium]